MSPFLNLPSTSSQGFGFKALIDREILSSLISIILAFILSPALYSSLGSSTKDQFNSEM